MSTKLVSFVLNSSPLIVVHLEADDEPSAIELFKTTFGESFFSDIIRIYNNI